MQRLYERDPIEVRNSRTFYCVICSERWPERQMHLQDGIASDHRCPNCFEPNGGDLERNRDRAEASNIAGAITARFAPPPKFPEDPNGFEEFRVLSTFTPEPRTLTAGGGSAVLTINGSNLQTDDTIAYGHAGITNSVAPALTQVTYDDEGSPESPYVDVLVLTVVASGAVPAGAYSLTYEGSVYRNVFEVRT